MLGWRSRLPMMFAVRLVDKRVIIEKFRSLFD